MGIAGSALHSGDCTADGAVAEHDPQVPAVGDGGAGVQGSGAAEQTGSLRREAVGLAEDGGGQSRKQRRTLKQLHVDLVVLGYEGSYSRVAAFARKWKADRQREQQTAGRGTFVPLAFQPGEAFQFDWSEDWATIAGENTKLQVAHVKLSRSRAFLLRAYPLQTHEMLFDAHNHAFRVFGGIPRRGIYDNMKTAVTFVVGDPPNFDVPEIDPIVIIHEPAIDVAKSVATPDTTTDAGDIVTYTLTLSHNDSPARMDSSSALSTSSTRTWN